MLCVEACQSGFGRLVDEEMDNERYRLARRVFWLVHDDYRLEHIGEFQGHPTGSAVSTPSTEIHRIVNGRIAGEWCEAELTGMLHKFGFLPSGR
jgi:hypothetical protein